ncbi:MAG: hypothetical protein PHQ40_14390 [Anaerolineaceae bacterium]|nr:hypothetical protein [Anaerolineaceae bacterium]
MKKIAILLLQLCLAFISLGCLLGGLVKSPASAAGDPAQASSENDSWAKEMQIDAGKENLTNYREQLHIQFSGKDEKGAAFNASQDLLVEIDKARNARREVETLRSPDTYLNGTNETVVTGGAIYRVEDGQSGGLSCEKEAAPTDISQMTFHTDILQSINPGKLLDRKVPVNGILGDAYELKTLRIIFKNDLQIDNGKVWIALEAPYILKAEGTLDGGFQLDSTFAKGRVTFRYEITDQNQVSIQVPVICANPPVDLIPLPSSAKEVDKSTFHIAFSSDENREQLNAFFLNELTAQGWKVEELPPDAYPLTLRASLITQQGIRLSAEVRINDMSVGSYVEITWQSQMSLIR